MNNSEPGTVEILRDEKARAYFVYYNTSSGRQECITAIQNVNGPKAVGLNELHKVVSRYYGVQSEVNKLKSAFRACEICEQMTCSERCKHFEIRKAVGLL